MQLTQLARRRPAESGQMVVAAIVLVALFFLIGSVMAVSIESNLHTIAVISMNDTVNYAAESAVARGIAAASNHASCPGSGTSGRSALTTTCLTTANVNAAPDAVQQWGISAQTLSSGTSACLSRYVDLQQTKDPSSMAIWTVIGWQASSGSPPNIQMQLQLNEGRDGSIAASSNCRENDVACQRTDLAARASFFSCSVPSDDEAVVHIADLGGPALLRSLVIRAAPSGSGSVTTVVGQSGVEVDEADVLQPGSGGASLDLWHTVLP